MYSAVHISCTIPRLLMRSRASENSKKILPLHFRFSGVGGVNADMARKNPEGFKIFTDTLKTIFAKSDIEIQILSMLDFNSNSIADKNYNFESSSELSELFRLEKVEIGVKIFFVGNLFQGSGIGGYSYGIGGPAISPESVLGGIAISSADRNTPTLSAMNLAHELGHYLGLYHVKENGRLLFDPIPDTDPDSTEVNIMDAVGSNNPDGPLRFFTPQQTEVISRSPSIIYEKK